MKFAKSPLRVLGSSGKQDKATRAPGYTMLELIIVIAVSGVILIGAVELFQGQNSEIAFDQAAQDINSALSAQIKKVGASYFPDSDRYQCQVVGGYADLTSIPGGKQQGSNQDCIYLGVAIEADPSTSDFYIYTVLGRRINNGNLVTEFEYANAVPVAGIGSDPSIDLTVNYNAGGAVKISSAKFTMPGDPPPPSTDGTLVGYFTDLSGTNATSQNGGEFLIAKGYPYTGPHDSNQAVGNFIKAQSNPPDIISWEICLHDTGDTKSAILQIMNSPSGVTTNLKFEDC